MPYNVSGSFSGGAISSTTTFADDVPAEFGTGGGSTRPAIIFDTAETPDTGMLLTGSVSNHWILAENSDKAFDFAHAATTDPTLFIHSHNQSTTEFFSFAHNGAIVTINNGTSASGTLFTNGGVNALYILSS